MAPILGLELLDLCDDDAAVVVAAVASATQDVDAQLSQVWTDKEQVYPLSHVGQDGVVSGHCTHRRKRVSKDTASDQPHPVGLAP
jgi:hypothetical protein